MTTWASLQEQLLSFCVQAALMGFQAAAQSNVRNAAEAILCG